MSEKVEIWCDRDEHKLYENFIDFNEWLDNREEEQANSILAENGLVNITQPSKAFFAGDKEAYDQAFKTYRRQRRYEVLSKEYLSETFDVDHWCERNEERFNQLIQCLMNNSVVLDSVSKRVPKPRLGV